ncbi:MAG TPA: hypothetical protein ENO24_06000, partial [Chloroflexi bacterium]|nr:hypothetical protein [Chloroflexota bacterium]
MRRLRAALLALVLLAPLPFVCDSSVYARAPARVAPDTENSDPPAAFLYQPFEGTGYFRITAYFDHTCPDYNATGGEPAEDLTVFSGHTLAEHCRSFYSDGTPAAGCTGPIRAFDNTTWELPHAYYSGHDGYDFAVSGQALSAARGLVTFADWKGDCGWMVEIMHDDLGSGYKTRYCHLEPHSNEQYGVELGTMVWDAGQPIGIIDNSGASSGTHLHFSVWRYNGDAPPDKQWNPTDPFGWDISVSPTDPLVACNGEQSHNLWVGGWPQLKGDPPTEPSPLVEGEFRGGWFGAGVAPPCVPRAEFLDIESFPDGTVVQPGQSMDKWWRLKNTGTCDWSGYQLMFESGEQMGGPGSVAIPTTAAGASIDIHVPMVAPTSGGDHAGYWRIVSPSGAWVDGGRLWIKVSVAGSTTSDHIISFTADPASPSTANTVLLHARVNWWSEFRAMRVRVGDQSMETSETDHVFQWDTTSVPRGDHAIVLEVATHSDLSWSSPERRTILYTLEGEPAPSNHAPNRPTLVSPYDWYVTVGSPPQLCAQAQGDPDGDPVSQYYFDVRGHDLWNSGWISSNCVTPS